MALGVGPCITVCLSLPASPCETDAISDTIYACQDRRDDVKVGVKSTAVMLGDFVRPFTFSCAVLFVSTLAYAGILNEQTPYFFYVTIGGTSLHLIWQYATVDLDSPDSCGCESSAIASGI